MQLTNVLALLEASVPRGPTEVRILLHQLAAELRQRSLVVLLSDLLADPAELIGGLEHLCYRGHELVVLHVLDEDEWRFPFVENTQFEGLEQPDRLRVDPQALRAGYLAALRRFTARIRATCLKHRADYVPISTLEPLDAVLTGYLSRRRGAAGRTGTRSGARGAQA
jgi:uncharacterized protein (DUF58 family)